MILDLEPIFNNEGLSSDFDYTMDLSDEVFNETKPFVTPVKVKGSVKNRTGIVELKAEASFTLSLSCDRCAKKLDYPCSYQFNHTLVTNVNDEDNDELLLVNELRFDLDKLVIEDIYLSLPSKFLCSEDCKGLCPTCGKDLNEGTCSCKKEIDPRLAALAQLLDK